MKTIITTERMEISLASRDDINRIMDFEQNRNNRKFLRAGTEEDHRREIEDPNQILMVFRERGKLDIIGYALIKMDFRADAFQLSSIVVDKKKRGFGKEAMKGILVYAFDQRKANRFWLYVYSDDIIGIKLYESLRMRREGTLRQSCRNERGYQDQTIFAILREDYKKM